MTYETTDGPTMNDDRKDASLDACRHRQWAAVRAAIGLVLHRWHPEFFPPAESRPDELDLVAIKIYGLVDRWMDIDLLVVQLHSIERETAGMHPGDHRRLRAAAAELLDIDFEDILDREGRAEPGA